MRMSRICNLFLIGAVALAGCEQRAKTTETDVAEHYANLVAANYADAATMARRMHTAIDQFLDSPSTASLELARESWIAARQVYGSTEVFRFYGGPIDEREGRINAWPLDENHIDYVLSDGYNAASGRNIISNVSDFPVIDRETLIAQNEAGGEKNVATGWHAIEFLLWGQDLNEKPLDAGTRPFGDYVVEQKSSPSIVERRRQYLSTATDMLVADLEYLSRIWSDDSAGGHRAQFIGQGRESVRKILLGMASLGEAELAGERLGVAMLSADQEDEHSCFSDTTHNDIMANAAGIANVYFGRYLRLDGSLVAGPSVADLVRQADVASDNEMRERTERVEQAAAALQYPFDREILTDNLAGRARVQEVIDALYAQTRTIMWFSGKLGLYLPTELDGD